MPGLETWTHLLFSTGLRCSPSETPYACGKCGTRTETWHLEDRPISPRLGRAPIRSLTPRLRERKQHEAEAKLRAREVRPRSPRARSASPRGPRGPRGRHVQRSLSSSVSATGAKHRAKGREHAMPPKSSKPSPADLARLQQELKAQIVSCISFGSCFCFALINFGPLHLTFIHTHMYESLSCHVIMHPRHW